MNLLLKTLFLLVFIFNGIGLLHAGISGDDLEKAIAERMVRVAEFKDIQEKCEEMQVSCYLFGGTAAAYASYVHRDLERELEHKDYNPYRFDYDLSSMFNSSQDYDIVMDGTPEQIKTLQSYLESKYPYMQGEHTAWEVRPLRMQNGTKEPLLGPNYEDNTDFLKQHTDSYSQGMVAITKPAIGEQRVLDLKYWKKSNPRMFLNDVANNQIHYLENDQHTTTVRYNDLSTGNPQILSVVRYLIKALQYGATIPEENKGRLSKIIADFDPASINSGNQYLQNWIEFNARKIMTNSLDVERSAELLSGKYWGIPEEKNLQVKLSQLGLNGDVGGLKWWMNKEPLRSTRPCVEGGDSNSMTAKKLGIKEINHVVKEMDAFENISRPYDKRANALISRGSVNGETASYGDGFYVSRGETDYYGTGMMIVMDLDENAIQGVDFEISTTDPSVLIIKNKNCIHRKYEKEKGVSLDEFVSLLMNQNETGVGYLSRNQKKAESEYLALTPQAKSDFNKFVLGKVAIDEFPAKWFSTKFSRLFPEIALRFIEKGTANKEIVQYILSQPHWKDYSGLSGWVEAQIKQGGIDRELAQHVLSRPHSKDHPEWVAELIQKGTVDGELSWFVLNQPHWKDHPELVEALLQKGTADDMVATYVVGQSHWKNHPEWIEALLQKGTVDSALAWGVLRQPHSKDHPEWVKQLIERGQADYVMIQDVLNQAHWSDHPEWVEAFVNKGTADIAIAVNILGKACWKDHPEWVETLIKRGNADWEIAKNVLPQAHWKSYFQKLTKESNPSVESIREFYRKHDKRIATLKTELAQRSAEATSSGSVASLQDFLKSKMDDPALLACLPSNLISVYEEFFSDSKLLLDKLVERIAHRL
ncbi:MAG: hypothetical protein HQK50_08555 [Oligoflexia bacterium]|nr:hypothetical protein [Oligoflexia bacterium]